MKRGLPLTLGIVVLTIGVLIGRADAGGISPRNPFRSFNVHGHNYGSMQWERDQKRRAQRFAQPVPPGRVVYVVPKR